MTKLNQKMIKGRIEPIEQIQESNV